MPIINRRFCGLVVCSIVLWGAGIAAAVAQVPAPLELGNRRELFIDDYFPARNVDHGLTPSTKQLPEWELREKRISIRWCSSNGWTP